MANTPSITLDDIWDNNKHLFSIDLQKKMDVKVETTLIQYNESTGVLSKPHDPYPDNDTVLYGRDYAIKTKKWPAAKVDLYRTVCRLGLEHGFCRKIGLVKFFGAVVDHKVNDDIIANLIAKELESYAQQNFIMGSLVKLGKMNLMDRYNSNVSSKKTIVCYVALNEPGQAYLTANPTNLEFQEGGKPPELP